MFTRIALLTTLVALAVPASAGASSIVYTKADGNVWLVKPDGSGEHQVTLDGSATTPYEEASQADDGTILARHGGRPVQGSLERLAQNGRRLGEPISPLPEVLATLAQTGPFDPELSPDGRTVTYTVDLIEGPYFDTSCACYRGRSLGTHVAFADAVSGASRGLSGTGDTTPLLHPSWVDSGRVMMTAPNLLAGDQAGSVAIGSEPPDGWFADAPAFQDRLLLDDGELTRAGDKLALVRGDNLTDEPVVPAIQIYSASGASTPPVQRCRIAVTRKPVVNPSWAPDGSGLVWSQPDGIWFSPVSASGDCGLAPRLIVPGGINPDWGPADVNPGAREPAVAGGPGPSAGGGGAGAQRLRVTAPRRIRRGTLVRRGLRVTVRCTAACAIDARLLATGRTARRLGLRGGARPATFARGRGRLARAGRTTVTVRVNRAVRRRLARSRAVSVTLRVAGRGAGAPVTRTLQVTR
jgi:hypothetical protein